jgi:dTMP kinase
MGSFSGMADSGTLIPNGLFISFEGCEGAGKSTQCELLVQALRERGYSVYPTREPGGTPLGEELRTLVKHLEGEDAACPVAEMLIMGASRAQLVSQELTPVLRNGGVVVCDRFADSTTVYQGYARGLDLDFIARLHEQCVGGRWPDLTIYLDLDVEVGMERSRKRLSPRAATDRFEKESCEFHETVRRGFQALAKQHPERIKTVDATQGEKAIHSEIMGLVDNAIGRL